MLHEFVAPAYRHAMHGYLDRAIARHGPCGACQVAMVGGAIRVRVT